MAVINSGSEVKARPYVRGEHLKSLRTTTLRGRILQQDQESEVNRPHGHTFNISFHSTEIGSVRTDTITLRTTDKVITERIVLEAN
jgi:hypothetical protein